MKKRIAVVAIAALMAGSLTNVGAVSAAEPTEITFWHYMSEDKEGKFVNEAIEEFNNSQDEVHVTAQYLPREELMKQYTIGVVSGELPDCGMVDNPDHASYASMGVFEDITDLYNSWDEADFMEGSINSCYYDDKLYGLTDRGSSQDFLMMLRIWNMEWLKFRKQMMEIMLLYLVERT